MIDACLSSRFWLHCLLRFLHTKGTIRYDFKFPSSILYWFWHLKLLEGNYVHSVILSFMTYLVEFDLLYIPITSWSVLSVFLILMVKQWFFSFFFFFNLLTVLCIDRIVVYIMVWDNSIMEPMYAFSLRFIQLRLLLES